MEQLLNQTAAEFRDWRANRIGRTKTPQHLQDKTLELLNHYPRSVLVKRLDVHYQFLNQLQRDQFPEAALSSSKSPATFVQLPAVSDKIEPTATIVYKDTRLEIKASPQKLVELVKLLEGEA